MKDADSRDDLVPTTFDVNQMDDANTCRDHAFDLWRWGETLKAKLEKADSASFFKIDRNLNRLSAALLKGLSDVQAPDAHRPVGKAHDSPLGSRRAGGNVGTEEHPQRATT